MKKFLIAALLVSISAAGAEETRDFTVRGVVRETRPAKSQLIVKHEEIPGYMDAMTMPFQVRDPKLPFIYTPLSLAQLLPAPCRKIPHRSGNPASRPEGTEELAAFVADHRSRA